MKCTNCGNDVYANDLYCAVCGQEVTLNNRRQRVCKNCGAALEADAVFCGECGRRSDIGDYGDERETPGSLYTHCAACGASMPKGVKFCANCGSDMNSVPTQNKSGKNKSAVVIIIILSVLTAALISVIIGYSLYSQNTENNEAESLSHNTETVTEAPQQTEETEGEVYDSTQTGKTDTYYVVSCGTSISLRTAPSKSAEVIKQIPLGKPVSYIEAAQNGFAKVIYNGTTGYALQSYLSKDKNDIAKPQPERYEYRVHEEPQTNYRSYETSGVVANPSYKSYYDSEYNFSCAYPSHFAAYNEGLKLVRYSLSAPDGTAQIKICATKNSSGLTLSRVSDNFVSSYPGIVEYRSIGDTWCATRTNSDGWSHYGYYTIRNGLIRGFEFHYDDRYEEIYDGYINDIYSAFSTF